MTEYRVFRSSRTRMRYSEPYMLHMTHTHYLFFNLNSDCLVNTVFSPLKNQDLLCPLLFFSFPFLFTLFASKTESDSDFPPHSFLVHWSKEDTSFPWRYQPKKQKWRTEQGVTQQIWKSHRWIIMTSYWRSLQKHQDNAMPNATTRIPGGEHAPSWNDRRRRKGKRWNTINSKTFVERAKKLPQEALIPIFRSWLCECIFSISALSMAIYID